MEEAMSSETKLLSDAVRVYGHSTNLFLQAAMPLIRDTASIDRVLAALPEQQRSRVARHMFEAYGEHLGAAEAFDWGLPMGSWVDGRERVRQHEAWVDHARRVAIPAIRHWLAEHPDAF